MKSYKSIFIALLAVLATGCNDFKESPESLIFPEKEIILTATREGLDPGTRSVRQDDGSVYWGPSEEVSVFYGSGSNGGSKFVSTNTAIAKTVELQGTIDTTEPGKEYWAVYPYSEDNSCDGNSITTVIPARQTGVEGNFSDNTFPAIAKGNSTSLAFWNICGGIKFSVSRSDIKSVTFRSNSYQPLWGEARIAFDSNGEPEVKSVVGASFYDGDVYEVTLIAPDNGTFKAGKYYYITMIPAFLSGGFTMTFTTETKAGSFRSEGVQEIKRSTFGVLKYIDSKVTNWESNVPVPEYVDLGLSVKWATFNVGASKPEEYGGYYAWGETTTKNSYLESNYLWLDGGTMTKYNGETYVLELADDAAYAALSGSWRMPTEEEMEELLTDCNWTWTTKNGVDGYTVSGKGAYSGNSIFLPAAGRLSGKSNPEEGWAGSYWTSTLYPNNKFHAIQLDFTSKDTSRRTTDTSREYGLPVRPVFCESVTGVSLNKTTMELQLDKTEKLTATVYPSDATNKALEWSSTNPSVAVVDQDGNVTGLAIGSADIIVTTVNGGKTAKCEVTVVAPGYEYVDLGLSVKWATFNVGALRPEEYGNYLAWGETTPKSAYNWKTYAWCNGSDQTLSKYNFSEEYGVFDNLYMLTAKDDAAHFMWSGNWRMPTGDEWSALKNFCTWTWEKRNGVWGYKVSGKGSYSGNSIFLPAGGFMSGSERSLAGSDGYYWASDLYEKGVPSQALAFGFDSSDKKLYVLPRQTGYLVRPVYSEPTSVSWVSLDCRVDCIYFGESRQLTATVYPETATDQRVTWSSDNPEIVSVTQEGRVTAATKPGVATITATTVDGERKARCTLSTMKAVTLANMGLSVNWASCNVGASFSDEYGDYFAWGETQPKSGYFPGNYLWYDHPSTMLTKYNGDAACGNVDNKVILDKDDDAAHAIWGGKWRTPTAEEWLELLDSCTWETIEINGVKGKRGVSKNPNFYSIFLPFAGGCYGSTEADGKGEIGEYWSSSRVLNNNPRNAYSAKFYLYVESHIADTPRLTGLPIRAVADK